MPDDQGAPACFAGSPASSATMQPPKQHDRVKSQGMDRDEMRRKREQTTVQLRKDSKADSIQKRRRDVGGGSSGGGSSASSSSSSAAKKNDPPGALPDPALKVKLESLPEDIALLQSSNPAEQLEATTRFRKLLSIERNPPIAEVIAAGAVPRLVQYCQCYDNAPLLFEATWTLTNISSGTSEHTRVVIDNGAIPIFVNLVRCPHADVREQVRHIHASARTHAHALSASCNLSHALSLFACVRLPLCTHRPYGRSVTSRATPHDAATWCYHTTRPSA